MLVNPDSFSNKPTAVDRRVSVLKRRNSISSIMTTGSLARAFSKNEELYGLAGPDVSAFSIGLESIKWEFKRAIPTPGSEAFLDSTHWVPIIHRLPRLFVSSPPPIAVASLDPASGNVVLLQTSAPANNMKDQFLRDFSWSDTAISRHIPGSLTSGTPSFMMMSPNSSLINGNIADLAAGEREAWPAFLSSLISTLDILGDYSDANLSEISQTSYAITEAENKRDESTPDAANRASIAVPAEVKAAIQDLGGIVATLARSSAIIPVRIGYEPRACNEIELKRHDVVSLWHVFDDDFGFG